MGGTVGERLHERSAPSGGGCDWLGGRPVTLALCEQCTMRFGGPNDRVGRHRAAPENVVVGGCAAEKFSIHQPTDRPTAAKKPAPHRQLRLATCGSQTPMHTCLRRGDRSVVWVGMERVLFAGNGANQAASRKFLSHREATRQRRGGTRRIGPSIARLEMPRNTRTPCGPARLNRTKCLKNQAEGSQKGSARLNHAPRLSGVGPTRTSLAGHTQWEELTSSYLKNLLPGFMPDVRRKIREGFRPVNNPGMIFSKRVSFTGNLSKSPPRPKPLSPSRGRDRARGRRASASRCSGDRRRFPRFP
jgi:hypothetical protein